MNTLVKVDTNTLDVDKERFARNCVEINLTFVVVENINNNGHSYNEKYEGLHIICLDCGCYRYHTHVCKKMS